MSALYPDIEPYESGMLDVGDGHLVHWEVCGNPDGKPALVVHGGPGSGCGPGARRWFDPARYRVVLFDQRGCGRSTPHASDPASGLGHNTTPHLVADMEKLRARLGIERWLLFGGSWGSTLILAYAQRHPGRVSEIVIPAVTMTRRSETDWLYRGVGRYFPEEWERFAAASGVTGVTSDRGDIAELLAGYARLTGHPDAAVRERAMAEWCAWEDTVLAPEPNSTPAPYTGRPSRDRLAFVRICAHYFSHGVWLEEGELLRNADRLAGIPGVLVHGRFDLGGPLRTAWELARAWPGAELTTVADAGHMGSPAMRDRVLAALDGFAARASPARPAPWSPGHPE